MDIAVENESYAGEKEKSIGSWENINNSEDGETEVRLKDLFSVSSSFVPLLCVACVVVWPVYGHRSVSACLQVEA